MPEFCLTCNHPATECQCAGQDAARDRLAAIRRQMNDSNGQQDAAPLLRHADLEPETTPEGEKTMTDPKYRPDLTPFDPETETYLIVDRTQKTEHRLEVRGGWEEAVALGEARGAVVTDGREVFIFKMAGVIRSKPTVERVGD